MDSIDVFWISMFSGAAVWYLFQWWLSSPKEFAKYSPDERQRLTKRMEEPLGRGSLPDPTVDPTGWRLEGERGQQVWVHYEPGQAPRPQQDFERLHLGLIADEIPRCQLSEASLNRMSDQELAGLAAEAAVHGAEFMARVQVPYTGHWANDYGGPLFLMPGMIIAYFCGQQSFTDYQKSEMTRYLRGQQNGDGGWGLHIDATSSMFGASMNYVALRLLGVGPNDPALVRARRFIHKHGGIVGAPSWAKFWLSVLNVYSWEGMQPLSPELWILPRWLPFHPWRYWCHCRMVYLPMAYLYGARYSAPANDPLVQALRRELYPPSQPYESVNWAQARHTICPLDTYHGMTWVLRAAFAVLSAYELAPIGWLRRRALDWLTELMRVEDDSTNFIDIGPVSKAMNMVCALHRYGRDSRQWRAHVQRAPDYLWQSFDGMKMQGYNGSQLWDTAFACQAIVTAVRGDAAVHGRPPHRPRSNPVLQQCLRKAYQFVKQTQVLTNTPNGDYYYRHMSLGAWPFSTRDHGWPIADCTGEGMKAVFHVESLSDWIGLTSTDKIPRGRLCDAVNVILSLHNCKRDGDDGGWPTYERKRAGEWLEQLNPATVFARIMVDYSYTELSSACVQALTYFQLADPAWARHRPDDIRQANAEALQFIKERQRADGSSFGSWAICFTYGAWFAAEALILERPRVDVPYLERLCQFLMSVQNADGGWSESWYSCFIGEYCTTDQSMPEQTSWALLALLKSWPYTQHSLPSLRKSIRRGVSWLIRNQQANGRWKQGSCCGMFNGSCSINYGTYCLSFPTWCLGLYAQVMNDKL